MLNLLILLATDIQPGNIPKAPTNSGQIETILSIAFAIIGALAFLMLTISGLRFIFSGGDPERVSKARNGIVLALIGLLVALTARAIVAYVVKEV